MPVFLRPTPSYELLVLAFSFLLATSPMPTKPVPIRPSVLGSGVTSDVLPLASCRDPPPIGNGVRELSVSWIVPPVTISPLDE